MADIIKRLRALEIEQSRIAKLQRSFLPSVQLRPISVTNDLVQVVYHPNGIKGSTEKFYTNHDGANDWLKKHPNIAVTVNWLFCNEWIIIRYAIVGDAHNEDGGSYTEEQKQKFLADYAKQYPAEYAALMQNKELVEKLASVPQFTTVRGRF